MKRVGIFLMLGMLLLAVPLFGQDLVSSFAGAPLPEKIAYVLSFLTPLFVQGVKLLLKGKPELQQKRILFFITLGLSVVVGVVSAEIANVDLSLSNIVEWVTGTFAWSQTAWAFWKKAFLNE